MPTAAARPPSDSHPIGGCPLARISPLWGRYSAKIRKYGIPRAERVVRLRTCDGGVVRPLYAGLAIVEGNGRGSFLGARDGRGRPGDESRKMKVVESALE